MSAKLVQHILEHPPRCVARFQPDSSSPLLTGMPSSEDVVSFALGCACGSSAFRIIGYRSANGVGGDGVTLFAPLALVCADCGAEAELFDPRRDGYDAEIGECWSIVGEGPRSEFSCPKCGAGPMEVAAGFQYPMDDDDFESDEEIAGHPQDFFTWFVLYGRCRACGALHSVVDYECA